MIIIGALMALALDDWRDKEEREARDQIIIEQLVAELDANRSRLESEVVYHRDIIGPIREAGQRLANENAFALPEGWEGTKPILLTRTAFDLSVMTGALARLPPEWALDLSRAYESASRGQRLRENINLATVQTSFNDGARYLRLQEEAIRVELQTAETLIPLLRQASEQLRSGQ